MDCASSGERMSEYIKNILMVDDDREICKYLAKIFKQTYNIEMTTLNSGMGLANYLLASQIKFDLLILDLMMPDMHGTDVCHQVRETSSIPIIMMTALKDPIMAPTECTLAFKAGVDHCISKPVNPAELIVRGEAIIRRLQQNNKTQPKSNQHFYYYFKDWQLDTKNVILKTPEGVNISISTSDFNLLVLFLNHQGAVLSRDFLVDALKARKRDFYDRSIDVRVSLLRKKIEKNAKNPEIIKTIHNRGYLFSADVNQVEI